MPWSDSGLILLLTGGGTLLARIFPMLVFERERIPETAQSWPGYIPVAAFAALVANDLLSHPAMNGGDCVRPVSISGAGFCGYRR
ncbi:MAG: AzlD domain-containing protein [Azoarcus sp.]|jgi:branched-subunit amino acid transport protein|nr:AzlD domain-containing protein [Azoarcus sp.]